MQVLYEKHASTPHKKAYAGSSVEPVRGSRNATMHNSADRLHDVQKALHQIVLSYAARTKP